MQGQETPTSEVPFNGLVIDGSGKGIRAKITVKGTDKFTVADKNGRFGLTNIEARDTLVLRYKRDAITIPVSGRRSMRIVWIEEAPLYEESPELVDYGFGYVKRREYADSSSGITGEMMVRRGFTDLQTAILTLIPSVQLVGGELVIRGTGSISLSNAALIICDGSPISSLHSINIHDVKSVEVQKGSNMYGLRGANGVIIIRTRSK